MMKSVRALAIAGLAAGLLAASFPTPAQATHEIGHAAVGFGLGFMLGNAIANANRRYAPPPPVYYEPLPAYPVNCWQYERFRDYYGVWRTRRIRVC